MYEDFVVIDYDIRLKDAGSIPDEVILCFSIDLILAAAL